MRGYAATTLWYQAIASSSRSARDSARAPWNIASAARVAELRVDAEQQLAGIGVAPAHLVQRGAEPVVALVRDRVGDAVARDERELRRPPDPTGARRSAASRARCDRAGPSGAPPSSSIFASARSARADATDARSRARDTPSAVVLRPRRSGTSRCRRRRHPRRSSTVISCAYCFAAASRSPRATRIGEPPRRPARANREPAIFASSSNAVCAAAGVARAQRDHAAQPQRVVAVRERRVVELRELLLRACEIAGVVRAERVAEVRAVAASALTSVSRPPGCRGASRRTSSATITSARIAAEYDRRYPRQRFRRDIRPAMAYAALDYYAPRRALHARGAHGARHRARAGQRRASCPTIGKHFSAGTFPHELVPVFGEMGLLGPSLTGYGCAGITPTRVRPDLPGARARRLGHPLVLLGAELARDVSDLGVRLRGAEAEVPARDGRRPADRLLRPDRARLRLEPDRHADDRDARRRAATRSTARSAGSRTARSRSVALVWAKLDGTVRGFLVPTKTPGLHRAATSTASGRCARA